MDSRQITITNHRLVPILKGTENIGLLPPLVDINESVILDVLKQCSEEAYVHLVIELSSLPSMDNGELCKMILGLKYIGVNPEAVQKNDHDTGIPIDTHRCFPDLYQALISLDVPMEPREAKK